MKQLGSWRRFGWPVFVALALLILFLGLFLFELLTFDSTASESPDTLAAQDYADRAEALLVGANPENGPALLEQYQCATCHVRGVVSKVAPSFEGIADRAADRHRPLTAPAYLYESIVAPAAYLVEGYANVMPANYEERLSDRELGDLLAYLLTLHQSPEASTAAPGA